MPSASKPYLSVMITFFVIAILFISGPVQAVILDIQNLPPEAGVGEKISFIFRIDIDPNERIPLNQLMLDIDGTECRYNLNGMLLPESPQACDAFNLTLTNQAPYTYGYMYANDSMTSEQQYYGYGYGYGYGSTTTYMTYSITWDTNSYSEGPHTIQISTISTSTMDSHQYSSIKKTVTLTVPQGSASETSSHQTSTAILNMTESAKLEIISIIIPDVMHPSVQESIKITIKNNGEATYPTTSTVEILNQTKTQTQDIDAGKESVYQFSILPAESDIGNHIAHVIIESEGKTIEREIPFRVEAIENDSGIPGAKNDSQQPEPTVSYDPEKDTLTVDGCLENDITGPQVTIDGKMKIGLMQDWNNCFHLQMSTSSLSSGSHTLTISGDEGKIYEKTFTRPDIAEKQTASSPTGNIIQTLLQSGNARMLSIFMMVIMLFVFARFTLLKE